MARKSIVVTRAPLHLKSLPPGTTGAESHPAILRSHYEDFMAEVPQEFSIAGGALSVKFGSVTKSA